MKLYVLLNIILCFSGLAYCQELADEYTIEMGNKNLSVAEPFVISVILRDVENRVPIIFPDISGLEKQSRSATSAINMVEGKKVVVQTISQQYVAKKSGKYVIPSFTLSVNGVKVKSEETSVVFSSGAVAEGDPTGEEDTSLLPELTEGNNDIFLSVQADKRSVFIREGFALRVSLFVAENAPVDMEFYRFNQQLQGILKKLRPVACWEENVGLEEIVKRQVRISGRAYTEYNMYQAQLFPLTLQDIAFPSVTLEMLVAMGKSGISEGLEQVKPFSSKMFKVTVKPLPPHLSRDQVAVGQYSLIEKLSSSMVYPGESVRYLFKIEGKGNIRAITEPEVLSNSAFDFYPPDVNQLIKSSDRSVTGEKVYDYFIVPRQDGKFPLGRYFQWVYFDPVREQYDTLRSLKTLQVKGEDYKLGNISLYNSLSLYDNLEKLDSSKETFDFRGILKDVTNAIVILLLLTMVWVFRK
jgi:hypothetical protein